MNHGEVSQNASDTDQRRSFLVRAAAVICGAIVALFPFAAGLGLVIDPWRRSRRTANNGDAEANTLGDARFVRICPLNALPENGAPQSFPVVTDVVDAWTHAPKQRIGMVFLQRTTVGGKPKVVALSAKCPHLGCFVDFNSRTDHFECPCHTSAFARDGERIFGPSQRGLDPLEVELRDEGGATEVYIAYQKFKPGIAEREPG
jgi:Rieske Fe-S protein